MKNSITQGQILKFYRLRLGLTQSEFSKYSGINMNTLGALEADLRKPNNAILVRLLQNTTLNLLEVLHIGGINIFFLTKRDSRKNRRSLKVLMNRIIEESP